MGIFMASIFGVFDEQPLLKIVATVSIVSSLAWIFKDNLIGFLHKFKTNKKTNTTTTKDRCSTKLLLDFRQNFSQDDPIFEKLTEAIELSIKSKPQEAVKEPTISVNDLEKIVEELNKLKSEVLKNE